jgi:hypothetical protein
VDYIAGTGLGLDLDDFTGADPSLALIIARDAELDLTVDANVILFLLAPDAVHGVDDVGDLVEPSPFDQFRPGNDLSGWLFAGHGEPLSGDDECTGDLRHNGGDW